MSAAKIVNAPTVILDENESPADAIARFYRELGWNGEDFLDPKKVRTTKKIFEDMVAAFQSGDPTNPSIGILMVSVGPGVDENTPTGKVKLLKGWILPVKNRSKKLPAA